MMSPQKIKSKFLEYSENQVEVTEFLIRNSSYFIYQDGGEISKETTKDIFYGEIPSQNNYDDKQIIGLYLDDKLIGLVDILRNYPIKDTWVIGLMIIDKELRGKGFGKEAYQLIETKPLWTKSP